MFLNSLSKTHKKLFMELAIKAAEANGVVELAEKNLLKAYSMEMSIEPFYSTNSDVEKILQDMKDTATESEKRIFLFEIMGILTSDEEFDEAEKNFLDKVRNSFEVSESKCNEMMSLLYEYSSLYKKIVSAVL